MSAGFRHQDLPAGIEQLASRLVEAVVEVRTHLGVGLVESVYAECLQAELRRRHVPFESEVKIAIRWKGQTLSREFRADLLIGGRIVVELKAVEELHPSHFAQLLTYVRLADVPLGFLINFHAVPLANGIDRRILSPRV